MTRMNPMQALELLAQTNMLYQAIRAFNLAEIENEVIHEDIQEVEHALLILAAHLAQMVEGYEWRRTKRQQ